MDSESILTVSSVRTIDRAAGANLTGSGEATSGGSGMANCELLETLLRHVFGPAAYLRMGLDTVDLIRECILTLKIHDIIRCSETNCERTILTRRGCVVAQSDMQACIDLLDDVMNSVRYGRTDIMEAGSALQVASTEDPVLVEGVEKWPLKRWRVVAILKELVALPRQPVYVPSDAVACDLRDAFARLWAALAADDGIVGGMREAMNILRGRETCGHDARRIEAKIRRRNLQITDIRDVRGVCFIVARLGGSDAAAAFSSYARNKVCRAITTLLITLALSKAECVYRALSVNTLLLAEFGRANGLEYGGPFILDGLHRDVVDTLFRTICGVAVHALPTVRWGHLERLPEGYAYNTATEYIAAGYASFAADASENVTVGANAVSRHISRDSFWLAPWVLQNSVIVFDKETNCRAVLDYKYQNGRLGGNSTWAAIGGEIYVITRIGRTGEVLGNSIGDTREYSNDVCTALEGMPTGYAWTYRCCKSYETFTKCCTSSPTLVAAIVYNALNVGHLVGITGSDLHATCCAPLHVSCVKGGFEPRGAVGELIARGKNFLPPGYVWTGDTTLSLLQPFTDVATDSMKVKRQGRLIHFAGRLTEPGTALVGMTPTILAAEPVGVCAGLLRGADKPHRGCSGDMPSQHANFGLFATGMHEEGVGYRADDDTQRGWDYRVASHARCGKWAVCDSSGHTEGCCTRCRVEERAVKIRPFMPP